MVCLISVLGLLVGGCAPESQSAEVRPALTALLPNVSSLDAALPTVVDPIAWDATPGRDAVPVILERPGNAGLADFRLEAPGETTYLTAAIYQLGSHDRAERFWTERPPVVAHRHTASNLEDVSGDPTESDLKEWELDPPPDTRSQTWQAICLSGSGERCTDVRGWVLFCDYAMEIRWEDPEGTSDVEWHPLFELVAEETADAAGCS